jgi:hypothetical protein
VLDKLPVVFGSEEERGEDVRSVEARGEVGCWVTVYTYICAIELVFAYDNCINPFFNQLYIKLAARTRGLGIVMASPEGQLPVIT